MTLPRTRQQSLQNTGKLDVECSRVDASSPSQKFPIFYTQTYYVMNLHRDILFSFTSRECWLSLVCRLKTRGFAWLINKALAVGTIRRLFHARHCFKLVLTDLETYYLEKNLCQCFLIACAMHYVAGPGTRCIYGEDKNITAKTKTKNNICGS